MRPDWEERIAARARQRAIGRELRRRLDYIIEQPIPDDMLELLLAIDAKYAKEKAERAKLDATVDLWMRRRFASRT